MATTVQILCPRCGEPITLPVDLHSRFENGQLCITVRPDPLTLEMAILTHAGD